MSSRSLLAATGLFVALVFTGCQSATPLQQAKATKTAEELLSQAITKSQETKSYHFTMNMTMGLDMGGMNMTLPMEGAGDYVAPDKMRLSMEMKAPMQMKVEMINIGTQAFVKNPGSDEWKEVDARENSPLPVSPADTALFFKGKPDRVEDLGRDNVQGTPVRHIGYTLDDTALKALNVHFEKTSGASLSKARLEVWVGESDAQMYRFLLDGAMDMTIPGSGLTTAVKANLKLDMGMSDFNSPMNIQAPTGVRATSFSSGVPTVR